MKEGTNMKLSDLLAFLANPEDFVVTYKGVKVRYLNEAGTPSHYSKFFVAGFEHGAHVLVHVKSYRNDSGYEAAWETWIDSQETIPEDELPEAFGPSGTPDGSFVDMAHAEARSEGVLVNEVSYSEEWKARMDRIHERAKEMMRACEEPEIVEGYEQQSNATGTGVVSLGHHAWMHEADPSDVELVYDHEAAAEEEDVTWPS